MAQKVIEPQEEVQHKEVKKVEVPKVKIQEAVQQKVEQQVVEQQEETIYVTESFIETFWDQIEGAVSRNREYRAQRQELYLKAIKETTRFNGGYRKTLQGLFEEATKVNKDFRNGLFGNSMIKTNEVTESLKGQVSEAANKLEELYLLPINTAFDLMEKSEKLVEENSESFIEYTNEAWNAWEVMTDNYLKQTRKIHQNFAQRLEDSIRILVAPNK
ncbi:hypothetical protein V7266_22110 [Neobacillus drentensis]|uniref:hypothetical protein n=1 Tax=Neobacillus drentensis TaxID=220684 RepID=UPI002FFD8D3B